MIKIEHTEVFGFKSAIRGMRNPMNSWSKSDSLFKDGDNVVNIKNEVVLKDVELYGLGKDDVRLMKQLSKAGTDHSKFLRMIHVQCDLTGPLYFLKEWDTYKVGTVSNSTSTMHRVHAKEFTLDDFSIEHLDSFGIVVMMNTIDTMNKARERFLETNDKSDWWQMIQLLPSSYNQKRTIDLNYQVLKNIYWARKDHKLDEWHDFCGWCLTLPYFKKICVDIYDEGDK